MSTVLDFEDVSLSESGPTLTLKVGQGQLVAVMGQSGSGKSAFIEAIIGEADLCRGRIVRHKPVFVPSPLAPSRRVKVHNIAFSRGAERIEQSAERVEQALDALSLWYLRKSSLAELSPGQLHAASLLNALAGQHHVVVFDQHLDSLDLVSRSRSLDLIKKRAEAGGTMVIATNLSEIAERCDLLILLNKQEINFAGTPEELLYQSEPSTLTVSTENASAVRALTEGFEISAIESNGEIRFEASEGQALAARLLCEGYGDVKFVVLRQPTLQDVLVARLGVR